jgi:hypothetical protein
MPLITVTFSSQDSRLASKATIAAEVNRLSATFLNNDPKVTAIKPSPRTAARTRPTITAAAASQSSQLKQLGRVRSQLGQSPKLRPGLQSC